ncbi:MAG: hypothetical protein C5B54_10460 [Acidobacteria bacterium]|nr:MAG: hypothetical protein C5B54_10460 [Acidobacteriota bacterium]
MLGAVEVFCGLLLLLVSFQPFQNYELLKSIAIPTLLVWLTLILLTRKKSLFSTSLFFHLSIILFFPLRTAMEDGHLHNWYICFALLQWSIVLWFAFKRPEWRSAPSLFLAITFVSPIYIYSLSERVGGCFAGIPIWSLLILRFSWVRYADSAISIPRFLLLLPLVCIFSMFGSSYLSNSIQFLFINCACLLLYATCRERDLEIKRVILTGYGFLTGAFLLYTVTREIQALSNAGLVVFTLRHHFLDHANTLAIFYVILSAIFVHFYSDIHSRSGRVLIGLSVLLLAALEFLTYSRNGWASYVLFVLVFAIFKMPGKKSLGRAAAALISGLIIATLLVPTIKKTVATRISNSYSVQQRLYIYHVALHSIAASLLFGHGWMNVYVHPKFISSEPPLRNLQEHQDLSAVRNHSALLDLADTGGIPLAVLFVAILAFHLTSTTANRALYAGLWGISLNLLFDTSIFWLVLYPHFWVLLGMLSSDKGIPKIPIKPFPLKTALVALFLLSVIFPVLEDFYLLQGSFYHQTGRDRLAIRKLRYAEIFALSDMRALEQLKDIYSSFPNSHSFEAELQQLINKRKDFAPYYAELGKAYLFDRNYAASRQYLEKAIQLDPFNTYRRSVYLDLAALSLNQNQETDYLHFLLLGFIFDQQESSIKPRLLLEGISQEKFLSEIKEVAKTNLNSSKDFTTAIVNLSRNLNRIGYWNLGQAIIGWAATQRDKLNQDDLDYLLTFLSPEKLTSLISAASTHLAPCLRARIEMSNGNMTAAARDLQQCEYWDYADLSREWENYYQKTKDSQMLLKLYQTQQSIPSFPETSEWQTKLAEFYAQNGNDSEAAKQFHLLSRYRYDDPYPHWREVVSWRLAKNIDKAAQANADLQNVIESTLITQLLYQSNVSPNCGITLQKMNLENDLGGYSWRTGFPTGTPCSLIFPQEKKFRELKGSAAIIGGSWKSTDGAVFKMQNDRGATLQSLSIRPQENLSARFWNDFDWKIQDPEPIQLVAEPIKPGNNDSVFWSFSEAH